MGNDNIIYFNLNKSLHLNSVNNRFYKELWLWENVHLRGKVSSQYKNTYISISKYVSYQYSPQRNVCFIYFYSV